ncbi:sodium:proton exchanger [Aurantiacibacter xanthus]|uniref:Sodium:proton exchanger n=1 Tax=Aurantiacibacter xanthus TaxID=1784712 RepID=A0A3A1P629_9SPHN|nr:monovalent cation:proton antiporter-2 (CPA2) family protein [Aurantiacibacter xanthus]RIV86277.1 sodium:proton exchanger [Aurantiacibacter xanthus]
MEGHETGFVLQDGALMLAFALVAVIAFRRAGLGATLGYLVAGVLIGPQVLGLVGNAEQMAEIAELGIVMLLFVVGLELSPERLWRLRRAIFGLGTAQVAICGVVVSLLVAVLTNYSLAAAFAIGLPLALSSTAQVLPMLQSAGRLRTPFGEKAFAILLFQDLSIIPLITIVTAMSRNPADADAPSGLVLVGLSLAAIAGLIVANRLVVKPMFRLIGHLGERELFVMAALFIVFASAAVMELLGLSAALGAFIAGVMLADTRYRHELEADIEPFRSILLGMFFLAVGMMLDLSAIAAQPFTVIGFAVLLIAVKTGVITALGLAMKMAWRSALALGLLLSQGGEFAFVLYSQAQGALLLAEQSVSVFSAVVTLSMAATPFLMMLNKRIRSPQVAAEERDGPRNDGARAVIVGFGRFGQTVAQTLMAGGVSVTAIDRKVAQIDLAEEFGSKVYFGDGTRIDMLRQAGATEAQLIMFCHDEMPDAALIEAVDEAFPQALIYVRAFDRRGLLDLAHAPAEGVVREVFAGAIRMARLALAGIGVSEENVEQAEATYRRIDKDRLQLQLDGGDLYAARELSREQQRELREFGRGRALD